jgi:hypothetical protein
MGSEATDQYLAELGEEDRNALTRVRQLILSILGGEAEI